jgi:hypothetical protein
VHVHLLLLCMRVLWRGESADLKDLNNTALITHRQTKLAVGFLFSGQTGDDRQGTRNQSTES